MSEKMRAIAVTEIGKTEIIEVDRPHAGPYEVVIKVKATSLCTVDQRNFLGIVDFGKPFIGGHEVTGEVVEVGDYAGDFKVGDKVVYCGIYCGQCENCKTGNSTQCKNAFSGRKPFDAKATITGGGLAEYLRIPYIQLYHIEDHVKPEWAALVEPLSCCLHSVEKLKINLGDTVVVVGCGIMGMAQIMLCKLKGARVIVSEPQAERRQKALRNGADLAVDPMSEDPVEFVKKHTNGMGAMGVINTTPIAAVWEQAMGMLAPKGKLIAYSSQHPDKPIPISFGKLHSKEYEYIGTVNAGVEDFQRIVRLLNYNMLNVDELIHGTYKFEDCQKAYEDASKPNTYRCVIMQD